MIKVIAETHSLRELRTTNLLGSAVGSTLAVLMGGDVCHHPRHKLVGFLQEKVQTSVLLLVNELPVSDQVDAMGV